MHRKLDMYAELIIRQGVNLDKGEMLAIAADIDSADLVEAVTQRAYKVGARKVVVFWGNHKLGKMAYEYQSDEMLTDIPQYTVLSRDYLIENKAAYLNILSPRPDLLKDVDPNKIKIASLAGNKALERFRESTGNNKTRWCLCAYPNVDWAKKIFPDLSEEDALNKLWKYVHKTMRLDTDNPLAAWKKHEENLGRRSKILNEANIKTLHYKNSLGTDFTVGLTNGYHFSGAVEKSFYGRTFTANMPTEEVFTSPDCRTASGKLVASIPLVRRGAVIKNFWLEFKDGKVVNFDAEEGYETLKGIIESDEGSHYLGEVALVGYNSPIQDLRTLFYNTLFDENASCHFAVGRGFSACIKDGFSMTKEQLKEAGLNQSIEHVDFMIGTSDLSIIATKQDGSKMEVFKDGDWVF